MTAKAISGILVIVTFTVWIVWDLIAYNYGTDSTISVVITDFAYYSPILPVFFGALISHWFWPAKGSGE